MAILLRNNLRARELAEEKVREINLNLEKLVAKRTTKLKESMGREHGLLKAIPDAVIQMNRDGFLSDYHAPHPNILPTRITKGCNIREAFAPEVSELFLRHAQSALETRATETFEVKLKGAEGLNFYEVRMAPSSPEEVVAIARDITERKRAEEQLRLQSAALEASANAIVITDREGIIQWVNPAFTALSGYSAEEAVGKKPNILKSACMIRPSIKTCGIPSSLGGSGVAKSPTAAKTVAFTSLSTTSLLFKTPAARLRILSPSKWTSPSASGRKNKSKNNCKP
ncbi:MAG: PAS domain S-box protein [Caldiserica bacterium]|jgi:PAS domain-containing protein|nr:PAS domain S-box protein [Caldisericota bacterium]